MAPWPNIRAALRWMDDYGDCDGDGFIEYARYARARESGLANQGWKDSHDAIFHADGSDAPGPIALCEVQAYAYAAKREAEQLRLRFEQAFWCEELGTYALALDGEKRACRVPASNAGHALFAGIAAPPSAPPRSRPACSRRTHSAAGASGRCRWGRPTRCPITTARSGRMTTR